MFSYTCSGLCIFIWIIILSVLSGVLIDNGIYLRIKSNEINSTSPDFVESHVAAINYLIGGTITSVLLTILFITLVYNFVLHTLRVGIPDALKFWEMFPITIAF